MRNSRLAFLLALSLAFAQAAPGLVHGQETKPASQAGAGLGILEAVRTTLELHPLLLIQQQQVDISRAVKQQRSADFDPVLQWSATQNRINNPLMGLESLALQQSGLDVKNEVTQVTTVSGDFQRQLRSGVVIGPRLEMNRTTNNIENPNGASRARLSFELSVPLRRGKGREVVTAFETSAEIGVDASLYELNQTIAERILATAVSYWEYVASLKQLEIITGSETRGKEYVDSIQTLIASDRLPRNELNQVLANFASRTATRVAYEGKAAEARNNLALAMGLPMTRLADLPKPSDSFPEEDNQEAPSISPESIRDQILRALSRRADFLAAEKRKEAASILRKPARNGLLPKMDLLLSGGYTGLQEGRRPYEFLVSPFTRQRGPDFALGLRYTFPLGNNLALGQIAEAEAAYEQTVLLSSETARVIANALSNAAVAVYSSMHQLNKAREAVTGYQAALEGERDKLRLAAGSLTDLLQVEARLTEAMLALIDAQQAFAKALVHYRFAGGTLIAPDKTVQSVDRECFFTLPRENIARE
jgi:outer membrane protein TolC